LFRSPPVSGEDLGRDVYEVIQGEEPSHIFEGRCRQAWSVPEVLKRHVREQRDDVQDAPASRSQ